MVRVALRVPPVARSAENDPRILHPIIAAGYLRQKNCAVTGNRQHLRGLPGNWTGKTGRLKSLGPLGLGVSVTSLKGVWGKSGLLKGRSGSAGMGSPSKSKTFPSGGVRFL